MFWEYIILFFVLSIITTIVGTIYGIKMAMYYLKTVIEHMAQVSTGIIQYYTGNKEEGRENIAYGLALDFGLDEDARALLRDSCELPHGSCEKCKWWTCPGKENEE